MPAAEFAGQRVDLQEQRPGSSIYVNNSDPTGVSLGNDILVGIVGVVSLGAAIAGFVLAGPEISIGVGLTLVAGVDLGAFGVTDSALSIAADLKGWG